MKQFVSGLLLICIASSISAMASDFTITPNSTNQFAISGEQINLHYKFNIHNNASFPLYLYSSHISGMYAGSVNQSASTCAFYANGKIQSIPVNGECSLVYDYSGKALALPVNKKVQMFENSLKITDQPGSTVTYTSKAFGVTVSKEAPKISWTPCSSGLPADTNVYSMSNVDGVIYVATMHGVYANTGGECKWEAKNNGLPQARVMYSLLNADGVLYAGGFLRGVFKSTDKGNHWNSANNGLPIEKAGGGTIVNSLLNVAGVIYAATSEDGIYKSVDKSNHWSSANAGLPMNGRVHTIVKSLLNANGIIYAGTKGHGIYTKNGNHPWVEANTGLPRATNVFSLFHTNGITYAGTSGGIYAKVDGKSQWENKNNGIPSMAVVGDMLNVNGVLFAATYLNLGNDMTNSIPEYCIYTSTNGGESWKEANTGLPLYENALSLQNVNGVIYTGLLGSGIYKADIKSG